MAVHSVEPTSVPSFVPLRSARQGNRGSGAPFTFHSRVAHSYAWAGIPVRVRRWAPDLGLSFSGSIHGAPWFGALMRRSFQFARRPFYAQLPRLDVDRTELKALWNHALAQREDAWRLEHRSVSYLDQQLDVTRWRNFDGAGLGRVPVHIAQDCLARLDLAYRSFFRRLKEGKRGRKAGHPRFRHEVSSFSYPIDGTDALVKCPDGSWRLKVPGIGGVPIRLHRLLPDSAEVKMVTLHRVAGNWFATLAIEVPDPPPPPTPETPPERPVGVDLGLARLAVLSDGEVLAPPQFLRRSEQRLRREDRRLSRRKKGSNRRERQKLKVARCKAKVRRQRHDFAHRLSRDWSERFDAVFFEDTDYSGFREGNSLAKGMVDAGWGMLRTMTHYKVAERSGRCREVPARGTTQTCSRCGRLADPPLTLNDRVYRCPCGFTEDRDLNAARNLLARGLTLLEHEKVRRSTPELTRGESGPPRRRGRQAYQSARVYSRNREPTFGPKGEEVRRSPSDRPPPEE